MPVSSLVSCVLLDFLKLQIFASIEYANAPTISKLSIYPVHMKLCITSTKQYQETKTMALVKQKLLFDCGTKVLNDQNQAGACRKTECALPQKQLHSSHVLMCWRSLGWTNGVVHTIGYTLQY